MLYAFFSHNSKDKQKTNIADILPKSGTGVKDTFNTNIRDNSKLNKVNNQKFKIKVIDYSSHGHTSGLAS
jgi:endo-alpha-1,4-polygalactosaminidase (GH114 family)